MLGSKKVSDPIAQAQDELSNALTVFHTAAASVDASAGRLADLVSAHEAEIAGRQEAITLAKGQIARHKQVSDKLRELVA